jgi:hypothetical protein
VKLARLRGAARVDRCRRQNLTMDASDFTFGSNPEALDSESLERFFATLDADAAKAYRSNCDIRNWYRDSLFHDYGDGFEEMELFYFAAMEAVEWAESAVDEALVGEEDPQFENYYLVLRGLAARSLIAYAEIMWLLRGGYPAGALARVRTLQELVVTTCVIAEYGNPNGEHPNLPAMYLQHRDVFLRALADDLTAAGATVEFDTDTLTALDVARAQLAELYGRSFLQGMWGWSNPLFPEGKRITMKMISEKVFGSEGLSLNYLYKAASAHIHAGSEGWHDSLAERGDEYFLATGTTNVGISLPATLASGFMTMILQTVIPTGIGGGEEALQTGGYFIAALERMSAQISETMSRCEDAVERTEAMIQSGSDEAARFARPWLHRTLRLIHNIERWLLRRL